jgi:hypothetical protein
MRIEPGKGIVAGDITGGDMSNRRVRLRTAPVPDRVPRHLTALPPERRFARPYLFLPPGLAARAAVLVTPFERRAGGLNDAEAGAVTAVRDRLAHTLASVSMPAVPFWIDAASGRTTRLDQPADGWRRRQLHDHHAVEVRAPR